MMWEPFKGRREEQPPVTLPGNFVVVCHILHVQLIIPKKLPSPVISLLSNSTLKKVGVGVKGDATRLDYVYYLTANATMDILVFSRSGPVYTGRKKALAALCIIFRGRELCKDMMMLAWSSTPLSENQIM